jgi:hypothetical protein
VSLLCSVPAVADIKTAQDHLAMIRQLAIAKWGEDTSAHGTPNWQPAIVKAYCDLAREHGDEGATPRNRRSQLLRVLLEEKGGSCSADTLILLYAVVDCRLEVFRDEHLKL